MFNEKEYHKEYNKYRMKEIRNNPILYKKYLEERKKWHIKNRETEVEKSRKKEKYLGYRKLF